MLLLSSDELPDGPEWLRELKFDGYRAVAVKSEGRLHLRSRNNHDFSSRYPAIASGLSNLPDETVIDGEIVALDDCGRPSFQILQNAAAKATIVYYVFDLMLLACRDVNSGDPPIPAQSA
jgi:ATP-dependent DNA ligase